MLTDIKVCTSGLIIQSPGVHGFTFLIKLVAGADPVVADDQADRESCGMRALVVPVYSQLPHHNRANNQLYFPFTSVLFLCLVL